ncbi:conserved hypothetical protein [Ferroglobus placidus DSM 10642]|uniref:Uncharacterized protein n=1 Tax=Ferroglobus placidus (strain DSM 10642 / AEDII12DO) TaxID=589924 RepID=D3S1F1_FERPA|nr:hypothetical protein [Ferroglobus placidus]ADC66415.1 conserved hypothetical protein [Ferroglobus placidus DSM 10642]
MRIAATIDEFVEWLKERGYDERLGEDGINALRKLGFSSLLFNNSPLLISFIFSKLGAPSERINERIRFEIAKRISYIFAERDRIEIEIKRFIVNEK